VSKEELIRHLLSLPKETEWVEFKHNNKDPEEIGEYISALSNAAALHGQPFGYIVWGVDNKTHEIVGTSFKPSTGKVKGQELESWLSVMLSPRPDFRIHELEVDGQPVIYIEMPAALHTPIRFKNVAYIRVGSYKKPLKDYPEKERRLWSLFTEQRFEDGISLSNVSSDDVLSLIDYPAYFEKTEQTLPDNRAGIMERLEMEKFIIPAKGGRYDITNLGAILFAKDISKFDRLARKALRVVIYDGDSRIQTIREQDGSKGYAVGFGGAISFINSQLPQNEQIGEALRKEVRMYPEIAIRELVANAIIHQDFSIRGTGPIVEIFSDRIEITNPGIPLIDTNRFIDEPPQSRNENLAAFMRRLNICEERGSGIDKVIFNVELFQLPPPDFSVHGAHTRQPWYAPRAFSEMSKVERIRACYQHACLCYVSNKQMTNASLRERFGIASENYSMVSRVISDAVDAGAIKPHDPDSKSKKHAKYIPFWL